jgi:prepilin-type N-terminal cleavage/methylation domain-containing protein
MSLRSIKQDKGFTIIELLIVIVVIGILAALVLNAFGNIQERARDTERKTDINSIHTQLELYYADSTSYPNGTTKAALSTAMPDLNDEALTDPNGGDINTGATNGYTYTPAPAGCAAGACTSYTLGTTMEEDGSAFNRNSLN